jgi:hypothetical protein
MQSHELEEFSSSPLNAKSLGDDQGSLWQDALQAHPALAEGQGAKVAAIEPQEIKGDVGGSPRVP